MLAGGGTCGAGRISLPPGVVGPRFGSSNCLIKLDSVEVDWAGVIGGAMGGVGGGGGGGGGGGDVWICNCCCRLTDSIWLTVGGGPWPWLGFEDGDSICGLGQELSWPGEEAG